MGQGFPNQRKGVNISAGTGQALTGTVILSNSNNVTFGMQTSGSSYVVTASVTLPVFALSANGASLSAGTAVFSNSNGISFGMNGSTVTASQGVSGADFCNISYADGFANVTTIANITDVPFFIPFFLPYYLTFNRMVWEGSRLATNQDNQFSMSVGVYTIVNSTQISLLGSVSVSYSGTNRTMQSGVRRFVVSGFTGAMTALSSGQYVLGVCFDATATSAANYALRGASTGAISGVIFPGANSTVTASSALSSFGEQFFGRFSTTTGALPNSVGDGQLYHGNSGTIDRIPMWFRIAQT